MLGGGLLAREASWDGLSDTAGVEGLLCTIEDNDGLLDPFFPAEIGGKALDFSAAIDAGLCSAIFDVEPVVTRSVLGLETDGLGVSEGVVAPGVGARGLIVPGVPTMLESIIGVADFSGAVVEVEIPIVKAAGEAWIPAFPGF